MNEALYPNWADLPSPAIIAIYLCLDRKDQCSMSLTCKNWLREHSSPELWRNVTFHFPDRKHDAEEYSAVRFSRKYAGMFRRVEIICERVEVDLVEVIYRQLMLFFSYIRQSKLSSIRLINLAIYFKSASEEKVNDICHEIQVLLIMNKELQFVEFKNARFNPYFALKLLDDFFVYNSRSVKELILEDFMDETKLFEPFTFSDMDAMIAIFMNLHQLTMDYSRLFEWIFQILFYESCEQNFQKVGNLKKLKLLCNGSLDIRYNSNFSQVWNIIKRNVFPDLKIDLIYHAYPGTRNGHEVFIVKHMPVRSLHCIVDKFFVYPFINIDVNDTDVNIPVPILSRDITPLLCTLRKCKIRKILEELSVVWMKHCDFMASELYFLDNFPKLKSLKLHVWHPFVSLETVFCGWCTSRPVSLEYVHITIEKVRTELATTYYSNIEKEYVPLLKGLGVNLVIVLLP